MSTRITIYVSWWTMQAGQRALQSFVMGLVVVAGLATPRIATAGSHLCSDIPKGDISACKAEVAKACSGVADADDNEGERAWKHQQCEYVIAEKHDQCTSSEHDAAKKRAGELYEAAGAGRLLFGDVKPTPDYYDKGPDDRARWIKVAQNVEASASAFEGLYNEWGACGDFNAEHVQYMKIAAREYKKAYREDIDRVLAESQKTMKLEGVERERGRPDAPMDSRLRETAEVVLAMAPALPASFRHREKELKAVLAQSAKNQAATDAWKKATFAAKVAATRCPAGKRVKGALLATLRREFDSDKNVKRRAFRQTRSRYVSRDGLISRENVPVTLCTHWARKEHPCETTNVTIFREKPPGGVWTSWRLAIGGGVEFNCKKF